MTVLSDRDIAREVHYCDGGLDIEPFREENLQPASYDLTLGNEFVTYEASSDDPSGIENGQNARALNSVTDSYVVKTGEFVLGHTEEVLSIPDGLTAEVKGRSSVGRLGLIPHTAGWVDAGFTGSITLEFVNHGPHPIEIESGQCIAQVVFEETSSPAANPYGEKDDSKYQGQSGVTESRIEEDT